MTRPLFSTFETAKYWAGQKLLHSPFHPLYLKVTGNEPRPQTYEEWLADEARDLAGVDTGAAWPKGYRIVMPEGAQFAPTAMHWFAEAIAESGADMVYADEDVMDLDGRRHSPVFKPAWSPELRAHCDYLGGAYVIRSGVDPEDLEGRRVVHIPRVLFHRSRPSEYGLRTGRTVPAMELVSIVICSRNPQLAAECLTAIRATTAYEPYEIILIDHCAGMTALAEQYAVKILSYTEDFNFARMCNLGARESNGGLLLFLNDDTVPLDSSWMTELAAQAARPDVGPVGALLTYPDGRIQHAGVYVGTSNGAGHPGRLSNGTPIWPWLKMTREQLAVTGACLMIRRDVFAALNGFDETFPVNYNDVDLCLRSGQAGYRVMLEARAGVEHRESTTRKTGIHYGERRRFLDRWAATLERRDPYLNPNLTDNELLLPDPEAFARLHSWR